MTKKPPFDFIRIADLDPDTNEPILAPGEGARCHDGVWYVTEEDITLEKILTNH